MPKKIDEFLYILCTDRAYIAPIHLMGPIVQPLQVNKSDVAQMLLNGSTVYEYDPKTKNTILLSLENLNKVNRESPKPISMGIPLEKENMIGVPIISPELVTEDANETVVEEPVMGNPSAEVEPSVEPIIEGPVYAFTFKEDGTVDESTIDWASFSKTERKNIRAAITAHNDSLNK